MILIFVVRSPQSYGRGSHVEIFSIRRMAKRHIEKIATSPTTAGNISHVAKRHWEATYRITQILPSHVRGLGASLSE